jgi:hypothetical protein
MAIPWGVAHFLSDPPPDVNHISSFWSENGRLYVVEHNRGPSRIVISDETFTVKDVIDIGIHAHNVVVCDNHLITCSSFESKIIIYDLVSRKIVKTKYFGDEWYPRGLAIDKENIWVGLTPCIKDRGVRNDGHSKIIRLDHELQIDNETLLTTPGQIICLRLLSGNDLAHNGVEPPKGLV